MFAEYGKITKIMLYPTNPMVIIMVPTSGLHIQMVSDVFLP